MTKPILLLDFDGVMHSYRSPWQGAVVIPDPPVPGLFEFLEEACRHFDIQVLSSRSHQPGGIEAMTAWLMHHRRLWREGGGEASEVLTISFPKEKPAAFITLDDRALTFKGAWPSVDELRDFKPWNKRERIQAWYGPGGALVTQEPVPGIDNPMLSGDAAQFYHGNHLIAEGMSYRAAAKIAEALGLQFMGVVE